MRLGRRSPVGDRPSLLPVNRLWCEVSNCAAHPVSPACADSLALPFGDGAFDGAMVAFGVRNLSDVRAGLAELRRVTRPRGRVVVLEFTTPPNRLVRGAYHLSFRRILPTIGRIVSGHPWAYTYLPESVGEFPGPRELASLFESVGFGDVGWRLLTGGIAALQFDCRGFGESEGEPRQLLDVRRQAEDLEAAIRKPGAPQPA